MIQNDALHLAQEFLRRMGSGTEPAEIAKLFSEHMEWNIAGDTWHPAVDRTKVRQGRHHRFR